MTDVLTNRDKYVAYLAGRDAAARDDKRARPVEDNPYLGFMHGKGWHRNCQHDAADLWSDGYRSRLATVKGDVPAASEDRR